MARAGQRNFLGPVTGAPRVNAYRRWRLVAGPSDNDDRHSLAPRWTIRRRDHNGDSAAGSTVRTGPRPLCATAVEVSCITGPAGLAVAAACCATLAKRLAKLPCGCGNERMERWMRMPRWLRSLAQMARSTNERWASQEPDEEGPYGLPKTLWKLSWPYLTIMGTTAIVASILLLFR